MWSGSNPHSVPYKNEFPTKMFEKQGGRNRLEAKALKKACRMQACVRNLTRVLACVFSTEDPTERDRMCRPACTEQSVTWAGCVLDVVAGHAVLDDLSRPAAVGREAG